MATPETRPAELANTWAETGDKADIGDVAVGWPSGRPGRKRMNTVLGWLMQGVRYALSIGMAEYSSACTYPPKARVLDSDGYSWQRVGSGNTLDVAPGTDETKWLRWGHSDGQVHDLIDARVGAVAFEDVTSSVAVEGGVSYTVKQFRVGAYKRTVVQATCDGTHVYVSIPTSGETNPLAGAVLTGAVILAPAWTAGDPPSVRSTPVSGGGGTSMQLTGASFGGAGATFYLVATFDTIPTS